jgi:hypothetical protein
MLCLLLRDGVLCNSARQVIPTSRVTTLLCSNATSKKLCARRGPRDMRSSPFTNNVADTGRMVLMVLMLGFWWGERKL